MLTPLLFSALTSLSSPQAPLPPPVQVLSQFESASDQVRRTAVETYSKGCRDRRARMRYRKQPGGLSRFQRAAADANPSVRLAAVEMAICFGPQKSAPALSQLVADADASVSLKAMKQVSDFSDSSTTAVMITWLVEHQPLCLDTQPQHQEHCIFALFATGQSARNDPPQSKLRLRAAKSLHPYLAASSSKAREVAAVALSFVGSRQDAPHITKLVKNEKENLFQNNNSPEVVAQIEHIANTLSQVAH